MVKWNKVSTGSNFIKNLLATTNLPLLRTVERGAYLSADCMYIYKCNIIKCTKSGYLLPDHATVKAEYEFVGEYTFNEPNGKICTTFLSNEEGYDSKTHERLGQYIRNLRDMYGLNLTPLYNCFSNNILANHYIDPHKIARTDIDIKAEIRDYDVNTDPLEVHGNIINKTTQTHNTIIYRIPIRFNQDYTICIENHGLTTIMPAFLQYDTLMKWSNVKYGQDIDVTNKFNKLHHTQQVVNKSGLRFNHPIKFRVDNVPCRKRIKYFNYTKLDWNPELISEDDYKFKNTGITEKDITKVFNTDPFEVEARLSAMMFNETAVIKGEHDSEITKYYEYNITSEHCDLYNNVEDHLYMLIQVPATLKSSIVVLEGDYTDRNINKKKYVTLKDVDNLPSNVNEWLFNDNLSLMQINTGTSKPFSETLLQYLLWHPISERDRIEGDGWELQNNYNYIPTYLGDVEFVYGSPRPWWDNVYRMQTFAVGQSENTPYKRDNLGYIDTDFERIWNKRY